MSAASGVRGGATHPNVGMIKYKSWEIDVPDRWLVAMGSYGMEPEQARQFAAEILNAADACEKLIEDGQ